MTWMTKELIAMYHAWVIQNYLEQIQVNHTQSERAVDEAWERNR